MDEQTHTARYILNKPIFACFVDFSKAFDTVWHSSSSVFVFPPV
jgi:hypothetical protein